MPLRVGSLVGFFSDELHWSGGHRYRKAHTGVVVAIKDGWVHIAEATYRRKVANVTVLKKVKR